MCHVCGAHRICYRCATFVVLTLFVHGGQNNGQCASGDELAFPLQLVHNLRVPMIDSRVTLASDEDAERDLKTRFDSRVVIASGKDVERDLAPELLLLRVRMLSEI